MPSPAPLAPPPQTKAPATKAQSSKPPPKAASTEPGSFACPNKPGQSLKPDADGRLAGHLPYRDARAADLVAPPSGFASGTCSRLHADAVAALEAMIAAARIEAPQVADAMVGLSCFRSTKRQKEVFCSKPQLSLTQRARSSAPPGHSEHHTGYAIDFGDRAQPGCDLNACFATAPVGVWMAANAPRFGFAMSFPDGNTQGVTFEPWHWRYQGDAEAETIFADANARFPSPQSGAMPSSAQETSTAQER